MLVLMLECKYIQSLVTISLNMNDYVTPRVLVSKCIEFAECRFNGGIISSKVVKLLNPFVEYLAVCPEVAIGLGVPRKALRLVRNDSGPRLVQTETEKDYTDRMAEFSRGYLDSIKEVDGVILKNRSPSCGTNDVRIYSGLKNSSVVDKGPGVFGKIVNEQLSGKPIENEGRLRNHRLRENFYTGLFTLARFREAVKNTRSMKSLIDFHSRHKFIFMSYDQAKMRKMGRMVANQEGLETDAVIKKYEIILQQVVSGESQFTKNINVLEHALGYFSDDLRHSEKELFYDYLEDYRGGKVPLSTVISLVRSWIIRFDQEYLKDQYYFTPYPNELVDISDSGKGRDL